MLELPPSCFWNNLYSGSCRLNNNPKDLVPKQVYLQPLKSSGCITLLINSVSCLTAVSFKCV